VKNPVTKKVSMKNYKFYYFLMLPGLIYFLIYKYLPMAGIIVAFKDVMPFDGLNRMITAPFVGLKHFRNFFSSIYFFQLVRNTLILSFMYLCVGFPCPVVLSLLINEVKSLPFKKTFQTISYLPHFLSMVVVAGMVRNMLSPSSGLVNAVITFLGGEEIFFLGDNRYIRWVITWTSVWQEIGWGSIIYLAALTGVHEELYEAAIVDGANRGQQMWHISIPSILPIISIMLILQVGRLMDAGFDRVYLLYNPMVYENADIIDTYVYRKGLTEMQYSYSTAVGLFKSAIAFALITFSNWFAKKAGQEGLW
jgi:putative aldouronate transport system permease protein